MSFLKKFGRQKSVDLPEEARKKEEKEKAKELKRNKRHSVHVSSRRDRPDDLASEAGRRSQDDSAVEDRERRRKKEAERKERERRKFKDMSGMVMTSPNEYPVFIVHYLGRMPADAEFGREAVEDPVHQLCKLREKQKLPKTLLAFNVEGMMCREVSGPFLKPKKEGLTFFIPLHHITYGVGSLTHPQVFAIITKMTDDPSPANQVLVLHAFLCDKPENAQALTYWQLQAYIEAFEDLKRKRMLKNRRKQAMGQSLEDGPRPRASSSNGPDGSRSGSASDQPNSASGSTGAISGERSDNKHKSSKPPAGKSEPSHPSPAPASSKSAAVKPKRSNSAASVSSSSSSNSSKRTTPTETRKSSSTEPSGGDVVQIGQKEPPGRLTSDVWPPSGRRGPPPQLRGPPPAFGPTEPDVAPPRGGFRRTTHGSSESRDSAYVEGEDEFPITFSPGTTAPPTQFPPDSSPPSSLPSSAFPKQGSSIPGIAPRKTSDTDAAGKSQSFESRISELQGIVEMDAEKLKHLMIKEYPTLSRKIYFKMSVDQNGIVSRQEAQDDDGAAVSQVEHVDDSVA